VIKGIVSQAVVQQGQWYTLLVCWTI